METIWKVPRKTLLSGLSFNFVLDLKGLRGSEIGDRRSSADEPASSDLALSNRRVLPTRVKGEGMHSLLFQAGNCPCRDKSGAWIIGELGSRIGASFVFFMEPPDTTIVLCDLILDVHLSESRRGRFIKS